MKRRISPLRVIILLMILALIFFVSIITLFLLGEWTFEAVWALASGWFTYPVRVIPQISYNVEMILCGLGAFGMALYFSHRLLKWLAENLSHLPSPWPFRFTAFLSFLLLSMFGTSIAMTGIIHQTAWLVRSESIVERRGSSITIKQEREAKSLTGWLLVAASENADRKFPAKLTELSSLLEPEDGPTSLLCPFERGGDAPWLYPAAAKTAEGFFPILVSPRSNHRGFVVVAYSDGEVIRFQLDELPSDVAIYFD